MNAENASAKTSIYTWLGLLLTYTSVMINRAIFESIYGDQLDDGPFILRELINLGTVVLLFWIIRRKEGLPYSSIGLTPRPWKEVALWSLIIMVASVAAILLALLLVKSLGMSFGESKAFDKLSIFSIGLVCVRAGVLEEVFMRGYQLERWNTIFQNKWIASALSLLPFALLHYTQGWAGIIISFAAGAVLTAFYWWKRNLQANAIAHFSIDFLANIP